MINIDHFGNKIAALRRKNALIRQELANKLEVLPQTVSKWKRGNTLPEAELLPALSHLYEVSVNETIKGIKLQLDLTGQNKDRDGIPHFLLKTGTNASYSMGKQDTASQAD